MVRPDLSEIPQAALPDGYRIRMYEPGDEDEWIRIEVAAEPSFKVVPGMHAQQFCEDVAILSQRQLFLVAPSGEAIGTTTAWFNEDRYARLYGQIHWVAVIAEFQGKGLSKALMTQACNLLATLGHENAFLITSTSRIPAVRLYLQYGFAPEIRDPEDEEKWSDVMSYIEELYP